MLDRSASETACSMQKRMASQLGALHDADQFRELAIPVGLPLISNDYLGLAAHPKLKEAIVTAAAVDERVASTGSRLLSGNHERWDSLESEFAEFVGAEAALYFASGYMANVGLLSSVLNAEDTVYSDASNHASLVDGIRLARARKVIFPHLDLNYLEEALRRDAVAGAKLIVVESIFSMDGDRGPLAELLNLCERYGAFLIIDEAHSTGVEGSSGRGMTHEVGRTDRVLATVHTCGKALASPGAFVAGSRTLREFLINQARSFIFSTALPPYCAAHVRAALDLVAHADEQRAHLHVLSDHLRSRMRDAGFDPGSSTSQIVPLTLGRNDAALDVAMSLASAGFAVRAIRPPTVPAGSARIRFSLNATLKISDINRLVDALVIAHSCCSGGL